MGVGIGTPHIKGAGYFLNNQNSKCREEADVQTCSHCQAIILMQQWKDNGAWCGKCMKPICNSCGDRAMKFGCEPFVKKIEQYAEKQMRFERFLKDAGLAEPVTPQTILTGSR